MMADGFPCEPTLQTRDDENGTRKARHCRSTDSHPPGRSRVQIGSVEGGIVEGWLD